MKKILKTTCAALLLASSVCSVAGVANREVSAQTPVGAVYSTVNKKGEYLDQVKIANYKKEVSLGSNYTLPTATMAGATLKNTEVLYNGKNVEIIDGEVTVNYIGTYTINYTFEKDSTEYVTPVTFRSVKADLYLSDVASSIPLKLPTVLGEGVSIKLPTPEVTNKDGEDATATVTTKVVAPGNIALDVTDGVIDFTDAKDENGELKQGLYYVTYTASIAGIKLAESKPYSFEVIKDYEVTELRFDYATSKPTTWELGTEKELPKVVGIDRKSASESETVNVEYKVKKIVFTKDGQNSDVALNDVLDGMKFKPNKIGTYTISYEVKDFLGNESKYQNDLVIEVSDTKAPVIKVVEAYEVGATTHTEALYKLPSKTVAENIVIMPMWAEDESSKTVEDGLVMSISIEDRTEYKYVYETSKHDNVVNKELVFNKTEGYTLGALQVDTGVDLVNGRTYRVYYNATDKFGKSAPAQYYDIKVDNTLVYEQPTVDFNDILPLNAVNGDVIEFSAPSFSDENDERLLEKVEYAYGSGAFQEVPFEDDMYRLTVDTEEATLSIRITAENNGGLTGTKTHVINIDDINDDDVPVITNSGLLAEEYDQNDLVILPTITVADKYIQSITAKVEHIDAEGKTTDAYANIATITLSDTEKQVTGSLTPVKAGTYRVRYTVSDKGNNLVIQDFMFYVNEDPELIDRRFSNLPVSINEGKAEVGETVKLPNATIIAGQGEATSHYVKVEGPSGSAEITNDKFVPYAVGTYKLQYVGKAGTYDIYSQVYTIEVKDTKAPTYYLNETVNRTADKGDVLTIPMISVDDGEFGVGVNLKDSYVSVKSKNSIPVKYSLEELYESTKTATLSYEEEYTLTYYIVDNAGNEATPLEYHIAVGDVSNPTIELAEDIIPATINKGDKITIDLADITINDVDDKTMTVEDNVTIKLWNTTLNKEVTPLDGQGAGKYVFEVANAGSYEFIFTVTDRANHSTEIKKTFVIDAESNNGTEKTQVIGTILIVVSVLALVGVILYFILTKRKNDRLYKKK